MELDDLEAIPGVGPKTAERLAELDDPTRALEAGDVATVARAPGISDVRAARITRAAIRYEYGDDEFLESPRARDIYESLLELLQQRATTQYAEKRLETFYPSGTESRIEDLQDFAQSAIRREPTPQVREALEAVEPLKQPDDIRVRDRCLATNDAETYSTAQDAVPEPSVELIEDAQDIADLARGYSTVIVLDSKFDGVDVNGTVEINPTALEEPTTVVPERTLGFFARNRDTIRAAAAVHRITDLHKPCDIEALDTALQRLNDDGSIAGNDEIDGLTAALDDLDAAVSMAESAANDHLRQAIEQRDVTIEGADLLSLVERGAGVDRLLERELDDEFAAAIEEARNHLVDVIGIKEYERRAQQVFDEEPTFPVEHNEKVVERLREELVADRDRRSRRAKQDLAGRLAEMQEPAQSLVNNALELDVELAVSKFARDYECTFPHFEGEGFSIEGGRLPLFDIPFEEVEPIDYTVTDIAVLSGVNSGGKTSTLDLIATVVILAHMGLPVPADNARLQRYGSLHYKAKTQGTLDVGAFESTLREFGSLVTGDRSELILVDELESITEPGASAVIIAGILEALAEKNATAVFVSHLADEIRQAAQSDITIDGIEAVGLKDGELQVNRSPVKNHLARSTPELIVEKLATETDQEIYDLLLEKFE